MTFLPWYLGGAALAAVMVGHWLGLRRMMGVSGRYTALVNRVRFGPTVETEQPMTEAEMIAALRAATADAFGTSALEAAAPEGDANVVTAPAERPALRAVLLLGALTLGGLLSSLTSGTFAWSTTLRSDMFSRITHGSPALSVLALVGGGALVGFGTRMAGGCTSGHGLCGLSRFQKGSLVSTAGFFGAGIAISFLLARLA